MLRTASRELEGTALSGATMTATPRRHTNLSTAGFKTVSPLGSANDLLVRVNGSEYVRRHRAGACRGTVAPRGGGNHDADDSTTSHAELDDVRPAPAMVIWGLNTVTPPRPSDNGTSPHLAETVSPTKSVTDLEHKTLLGEQKPGQAGASGDNVIKTTGLLGRPVLQGAQESRSKWAGTTPDEVIDISPGAMSSQKKKRRGLTYRGAHDQKS